VLFGIVVGKIKFKAFFVLAAKESLFVLLLYLPIYLAGFRECRIIGA
jgi:hypothetical protein